MGSGDAVFDESESFDCESSLGSFWKANFDVTRYLTPSLVVAHVSQDKLICFHLHPLMNGSELIQEVISCGGLLCSLLAFDVMMASAMSALTDVDIVRGIAT